MNITDLVFIFLFLPCSLLAYYTVRRELKDYVLLALSLAFYAFGSMQYFLRFMLCICITVALGRMMHAVHKKKRLSFCLLMAGSLFNIAILAHYKYGAFGTSALLPMGISFFTFKAISYLADIHRETAVLSGIPVRDALYLSFFPQIQSGPLAR
ncbi:MAG: hypothetical protein II932_03285, partial [Treponema sp.]|nr:hypothetical protein [Treponema sp.]